jgi:FKBP-type peptidyl-prolyl cis-trans isomerase SlyD
MQIEANKVVTFHFRLSEAEQGLVEDSHDGQPAVYLHGHQGLIDGLENALAGKKVGDQFSVTLPPEQAYGLRQDNAVQRVSINHVISHSKRPVRYKPGMVVHLNTKDGPREVVVLKAGLKSLDVDLNHPLAGKTLTFDIEVLDVRDASDEEIAHGHVHGQGGHHH